MSCHGLSTSLITANVGKHSALQDGLRRYQAADRLALRRRWRYDKFAKHADSHRDFREIFLRDLIGVVGIGGIVAMSSGVLCVREIVVFAVWSRHLHLNEKVDADIVLMPLLSGLELAHRITRVGLAVGNAQRFHSVPFQPGPPIREPAALPVRSSCGGTDFPCRGRGRSIPR